MDYRIMQKGQQVAFSNSFHEIYNYAIQYRRDGELTVEILLEEGWVLMKKSYRIQGGSYE